MELAFDQSSKPSPLVRGESCGRPL